MTTIRVTRESGALAYDDQGAPSDTAVICLPSLGDIRSEYRLLTPRLRVAGARVLTTDLRGMGESDATFARHEVRDLADDIIAVLDHARVERAVLAGSSISGAAGILAAARHPDRVRGLLLLGPVARDLPIGRYLRPLMRPLFGGPWGAWLWSAYYGALFKRTPPSDLSAHRAMLESMLRERARRRALVELLRADRRDVEAAIGSVHAPAVVVMGSADPDFPDPRAEVRWLEGALGGGAHSVVLEGVGHYPHLEDPDAVVAAFRRLVPRDAARTERSAG